MRPAVLNLYMWNCSSLLVLYGLPDTVFEKKLSNSFGRLRLLKKQLNFEIWEFATSFSFKILCGLNSGLW